MEERRKNYNIAVKKIMIATLVMLGPSLIYVSVYLLHNTLEMNGYEKVSVRDFELEKITVPYGEYKVYVLPNCSEEWDGKTYVYSSKVFVCQSHTHTLKETVLHEVGHHVYSELTKEQRKEWDAQFNSFNCDDVNIQQSLRKYYCDYYYAPDEVFARNFAENNLKISEDHKEFFNKYNIIRGA